MSYLTPSQYEGVLDRHLSLYNDGGTPNQQWMQDDIDGADAEINGYLARRYVTPVVSTADANLLRRLSTALAREAGFGRRPSTVVPEGVKDAAAIARRTLRDLAAGTMLLTGAAAVAASSTGGTVAGSVIVSGDTPEMTRDKLGGW